ncbi:helix-turn-helix domain-containing protein [Aeromicrobium endophyticum]|uniref:XRE family transcriptional regulator n=1 Tax=Aeromicrobium endophyticum TaxID=2292704 RepID=A0A371P3E8_9ACTN|nr:helix-turn-helix domain-containing protein [Aeromicrobium endophyticum]REK70474.1 XRE family transcriptional regulator [Aeromicrobium endophyticum]
MVDHHAGESSGKAEKTVAGKGAGRVEQIEVAHRLRSARETLGLTQEDVASALGIPRTSVIAMEAGKRNVTALELRRLARLYQREVAWLLGEGPETVDEGSAENQALFRATANLSEEDKEQVLRFAQFLAAGEAPPGLRNRVGSPPPRRTRTRDASATTDPGPGE